jgi:UDPglucose--hexose-1-phosphate uridylyltransferase
VPDDVRRDELTGTQVVVAAARQDRPNQPDGGCPFCVGGREAPEPYRTRWFPNRWPTFAGGRSEVHLFSPDHSATLATLGADALVRVVDLWAVTEVPDVPARELASDSCALCGDIDDALVVVAGSGWRAWVPAAPVMPYELRIAPAGHVPDLPSLDGGGRAAFAEVLGDALARLDRLFGGPVPRMLWLHQRPTDGGSWPTAHVHVHVHPLWRSPGVARYVAAGELGSGMHVVPVDPLDAAAALRSC